MNARHGGLFPLQIQMGEPAGNNDQISRPVADHLVGHVATRAFA